ncbi:hypothetical protein M8C21_030862, partial [Ambrosia artemisiifolia]
MGDIALEEPNHYKGVPNGVAQEKYRNNRPHEEDRQRRSRLGSGIAHYINICCSPGGSILEVVVDNGQRPILANIGL